LLHVSRTTARQAIYAESDEEYESIVAEMISQANAYGYEECVEFQENEATIRAAAEDAANICIRRINLK